MTEYRCSKGKECVAHRNGWFRKGTPRLLECFRDPVWVDGCAFCLLHAQYSHTIQLERGKMKVVEEDYRRQEVKVEQQIRLKKEETRLKEQEVRLREIEKEQEVRLRELETEQKVRLREIENERERISLEKIKEQNRKQERKQWLEFQSKKEESRKAEAEKKLALKKERLDIDRMREENKKLTLELARGELEARIEHQNRRPHSNSRTVRSPPAMTNRNSLQRCH